jgi:hypothetical protein
MLMKKIGIYSIKKDGTQYYKIFRKRTIIARFLLFSQAENYLDKILEKEGLQDSK